MKRFYNRNFNSTLVNVHYSKFLEPWNNEFSSSRVMLRTNENTLIPLPTEDNNKVKKFYPANKIELKKQKILNLLSPNKLNVNYIIAEAPTLNSNRSKEYFYKMVVDQSSNVLVVAPALNPNKKNDLDPDILIAEGESCNFNIKDQNYIAQCIKIEPLQNGRYQIDNDKANLYVSIIKISPENDQSKSKLFYQIVNIIENGYNNNNINPAIVPSNIKFSLRTVDTIQKYINDNNILIGEYNPIISMCTAGLDRSATFVLLDDFLRDIDFKITQELQTESNFNEFSESYYSDLQTAAKVIESQSTQTAAIGCLESSLHNNYQDDISRFDSIIKKEVENRINQNKEILSRKSLNDLNEIRVLS